MGKDGRYLRPGEMPVGELPSAEPFHGPSAAVAVVVRYWKAQCGGSRTLRLGRGGQKRPGETGPRWPPTPLVLLHSCCGSSARRPRCCNASPPRRIFMGLVAGATTRDRPPMQAPAPRGSCPRASEPSGLPLAPDLNPARLCDRADDEHDGSTLLSLWAPTRSGSDKRRPRTPVVETYDLRCYDGLE
jgi:hypothetical protein